VTGPRLSLRSAIALVVANMIGVGVFTTSGFALADLGSRWLVLVAWLLGGLLATCGALCYGALALRLPESGGEYAYLRRTLHPFAGVLAGLVSLLAGFAAPLALAARTLEVYGSRLLGIDTPGLPWVASAVLVLAAALHSRGLRIGARWQDLAVWAKLGLIALFLVLALPAAASAAPAATDTTPTPFAGLANSLPWIALAYSGWNAAVYVAGEIDDPRRNVPRALLVGTLLVTVLYLALNAAFLYAVPPADLRGKPEVAAIAAHALLGRGGEVFVTAIVVLALLTSVLGMTMIGPRVTARMAADGVLPRWLAHATGGTPRTAMGLQTALALGFLWIAGLQDLMTYIGWTLSLCAAVTVLGLLRLRWREGAAAVPIPGYPVVPLVFLVGVGWFAVGNVMTAPGPTLLGLAVLALAAAATWALGKSRNYCTSSSRADST